MVLYLSIGSFVSFVLFGNSKPSLSDDDHLDSFEESLFALKSGIQSPAHDFNFQRKIKITETSTESNSIPNSQTKWAKNRDYAVIIDAGSSGSRVYIYSWKSIPWQQQEHSPYSLLPKIEKGDMEGKKWILKEETGISSFSDSLSDIGKHMDPLLKHAKSLIPIDKHSSTPILLFATAGLRLLPRADALSLLKAACEYTRKTTQFHISEQCSNNFRMISGTAEGLFGWLATNYLMKSFNGSPMEKTFGFVDLGGASSQIAFLDNNEKSELNKKIKLRNLDGVTLNFSVFVATFLGMGMNEARRRYMESLFKSNSSAIAKDPCLPSEHQTDETYEFIQHEKDIKYRGTGDFQQCLKDQISILNKHVPCPTESCLLNGISDPRNKSTLYQFVGVAEFWYTSNDILGMDGKYDLESLTKATEQFCTTPSPTLRKQWLSGMFNKSKNVKDVYAQCFKSAWVINILYNGFGIPISNSFQGKRVPYFQAFDKVNDFPLSWTLGVMLLYLSESIPSHYESATSLRVTSSFLSRVVFFGMLIVTIFFLSKKVYRYFFNERNVLSVGR